MKILQICPKIPFSPKDGGSLAMNMLTKGLIAQGNTVHVLAISTPQYLKRDEEIDNDYRKKTSYRSVYIDTTVKRLPAFLNLFSNKSYNVIRFYSKEFEETLIEQLKKEDYDIIQLESIFVSLYLPAIRKHSKAKVVLRSHNVEYMIWERLTKNCSKPIKKMYLSFLTSRLKKYELSSLNSYDAVATITSLDANIYKDAGCSVPMIHIPFGIDLHSYQSGTANIEAQSVFHLGSMDWQPNIDAVNWFMKNCWLQIGAQCPDYKLYLAGRNMPEELMHLNSQNVRVEGEVVDANEFMQSKSIMIVPLSSGGGMRVKIIEGMALGKTIVSTTIGAEGIEYSNDENILIADSETDFVKAVVKCLMDEALCMEIGKNARKLAEKKYNNQHICEQLSDFYKSLLN